MQLNIRKVRATGLETRKIGRRVMRVCCLWCAATEAEYINPQAVGEVQDDPRRPHSLFAHQEQVLGGEPALETLTAGSPGKLQPEVPLVVLAGRTASGDGAFRRRTFTPQLRLAEKPCIVVPAGFENTNFEILAPSEI